MMEILDKILDAMNFHICVNLLMRIVINLHDFSKKIFELIIVVNSNNYNNNLSSSIFSKLHFEYLKKMYLKSSSRLYLTQQTKLEQKKKNKMKL